MSYEAIGYVYYKDGSIRPIASVWVHHDCHILFNTDTEYYLYLRNGYDYMFYKKDDALETDVDKMTPVNHLIDHIEISNEFCSRR